MDNFLVLCISCLFGASERIVPLPVGGFVRIDLTLLQILLRQKLGVAAKQYVGTSASHVRGDRYLTLTPGLRHDVGFARRVLGLGVQDIVWNVRFLQSRR